jgi:hypothetical protein
MGERKIRIMQSAANSIADIAWFIESKGLLQQPKNSQTKFMIFLKGL